MDHNCSRRQDLPSTFLFTESIMTGTVSELMSSEDGNMSFITPTTRQDPLRGSLQNGDNHTPLPHVQNLLDTSKREELEGTYEVEKRSW